MVREVLIIVCSVAIVDGVAVATPSHTERLFEAAPVLVDAPAVEIVTVEAAS